MLRAVHSRREVLLLRLRRTALLPTSSDYVSVARATARAAWVAAGWCAGGVWPVRRATPAGPAPAVPGGPSPERRGHGFSA